MDLGMLLALGIFEKLSPPLIVEHPWGPLQGGQGAFPIFATPLLPKQSTIQCSTIRNLEIQNFEKIDAPWVKFFIGLKPSQGHADQEYIWVGSCICHGLGGDRAHSHTHTYIHTERPTL